MHVGHPSFGVLVCGLLLASSGTLLPVNVAWQFLQLQPAWRLADVV